VNSLRSENDSLRNSLHESLPAHDSMHGARAVVVNRTHRVVREQALHMQEQKQKSRSLWVPLVFFSGLMLMIGYGIWATLDSYDFAPDGVPDASDQLILFLLWVLPLTALVVGLVWFKRGRSHSGGEVQQ
jgi:hypothetical protein